MYHACTRYQSGWSPTSQKMMRYENNFFEMFQKECMIYGTQHFSPFQTHTNTRQLHLALPASCCPVYDLRDPHYFRILLTFK